MENRQHRGIGAEHRVIFDLLERGLSVETPILPNSVHDLSSFGLRIQVKCGSSDGTKIAVDIRRPSAQERRYSPSDIDVFAIVDPLSRHVAYVPISEVKKRAKTYALFSARSWTFRNALRI